MRIKNILFFIAVIISLQATTAYGIGVGVNPGNMSFKLAPGTSVDQLLYVMNTGNETANYDVFVNESNYRNWFTFSPSSFTLQPGETEAVKVTLTVPVSTETEVKCKIKVPCTVPGKTVGAGIIVPVQIKISILYVWDSFTEYVGKSGLNEIKQFFVNYRQTGLNFMQNITDISEKMKGFAGNSEAAATDIFNNTTKNPNNTITSSGENDPSAAANIHGYAEKLHALPGFNTSLELICLAISGLLMRKRTLR